MEVVFPPNHPIYWPMVPNASDGKMLVRFAYEMYD